MAERLPVGAARNGDISPIDRPNGQTSPPEEETESITGNRSSGHQKPPDAASRNSGRNGGDDEWVEQDEPGVYITLTSLPNGTKDLKRVRFSRKRFSEKQAEQWWAENRTRVYEQYNVRMMDKSSVGIGSERNSGRNGGDDEWVEQDEPGVYIKLTSLPNGTKDLKRVRFRDLVRSKQNNGGRKTEREFTNNIMFE